MSAHTKDPVRQILLENPWYTDDQFARQLGNPITRDTIETRWRIFSEVLGEVARQVPRPVRILDAGCGDGINLIGLREIAAQLGVEVDICACDYNPVRVERAKRLGFMRIVKHCALDDMPFGDQSFDMVLCNHVLEHIPELGSALNGLRRVTASKGILVVNVPNEGCAFAQFRNRVLQPFLMQQTDHVQFFTRRDLGKYLRAAELDIIGWRHGGFFYPHTQMSVFMKRGGLRLGLTHFFGRVFPSQAADLIALATPSVY